MPRSLRFSLANALLALTCVALAIGWWSTVELSPVETLTDRPPSGHAIRTLPLTISASDQPGLSGGWYLSVNSAGDGELRIVYRPDVVRPVKVTEAQLDELKELLIDEKFFELQADYGELVPDGGTQSLIINVGQWTKTVRIHFLGNWLMSRETAKLREPARALRVWMLIRGWFDHPQASDSRPYDQRVLNAVSGDQGRD